MSPERAPQVSARPPSPYRRTSSGFSAPTPQYANNRAKGRCMLAIGDWARSRHITPFMTELSVVNAELGDLTKNGGIVASGWYPIAWYRDTHTALRRATGGGYQIARELGRESVKHDLSRGVYKVFLKIVSPEFLLERAPALFARYIEKGKIESVEVEPTRACFKFLGCDGFDTAIFQDLLGGCEGALHAARAKNVSVTAVGGGRDGDTFISVRASWT